MATGKTPNISAALEDEDFGVYDPDEDEPESWRAARELADCNADATWMRRYGPFGSQRAFHDLPSRFKGFSGPVGSGKSAALCREALRLAYANPGCTGLIGAPTYPMLRDSTRASFVDMLETSGIEYRQNKSENSILVIEPGSLVIFRSLEEYERIRGTNLAWFAVDELTYCRQEAWLRLEARLRDQRARELCGFAVWTPKGFDWVWGRFIGDDRLPGHAAVLATPGENTALPAGYYEGLKHSYDERFYRQEALGEYLSVFAGQAYYAFDRTSNVGPVEFDPRHPLCWSLDFNVDPMCSVLAQVIDGRARILDEMILPDSNTHLACDEFLERSDRYWRAVQPSGWAQGTVRLRVTLYGDPAGEQRHSNADKTDWRIVREWFGRNADRFDTPEFRVPSAHPRVRARVNAVNAMLRNGTGENRLQIAPVCRELIKDFERVTWKRDGAGNVLSDLDKSDPKRTHVSDAVGYLIEREFGIKQGAEYRKERIF